MTPEQRREICRRAGQIRAQAFTSAYQKAARAAQRSEMSAAAGRKSFAAACKRYGLDGAMEHLAKHRRAHPTLLEQVVMTWLDTHYIAYEREVRIAGIYVDFHISGTRIVVEADGDRWHTLDPLHGQDRASRDLIHGMALTTAGYTLIRLKETAIKDGSAFIQLEAQL